MSIDRTARPALVTAILICGACATATPHWLPADSTSGLQDRRLTDVAARYWAWTLEDDPIGATELGVHAFDDQLPDRSVEGIARRARQMAAFRDELRGVLPTLSVATDRTSAELLAASLDARVSAEVCAFHEWSVSAYDNPLSEWNYLPELHTVKNAEDARALLARYRGIGAAIDIDAAHLARGLAQGKVGNAESVRRVIAMMKAQLASDRRTWALLGPARTATAATADGRDPAWTAEARATFAGELSSVVTTEIVPALERYLVLLEQKVAPAARSSANSGLSALTDGAACYRAQIMRFTGLPLDPDEVHASGLAEIAELDAEIATLGGRALGTTGLPQTLARLRSDPALYFLTAEEIETKAGAVLAQANAAAPNFFGILPKASCVVTRVPDYEAPFTTIAYYRPPVPDGSKPGQYFVNVHAPSTRPRFEAAVLAVHEAVPGHHLQIAIAQERAELPAFRKHLDATAFVEGWALYTERLAEEMGLYADDLDRVGMLSFDAWRAARLVVDTGIHAKGWSREQAVEFMLAHTALSKTNIENEVDRYISWPAQALAYKTGQREMWRLRRQAEERLGQRFSLSSFHDVVLGQGAVSLPVLRAAVEAWIAAQGAR